jgi:hypothetical protein
MARSDFVRAVLACLILAGVFALATYMGSGDSQATRTASLRQAPGDDELTTGSIVFVPILGNRCRRRLIDNATWLMRDDGEVDCSTALTESTAGRTRWSAARVDIIRRGFRKQ